MATHWSIRIYLQRCVHLLSIITLTYISLTTPTLPAHDILGIAHHNVLGKYQVPFLLPDHTVEANNYSDTTTNIWGY